MSKKIDEKYKKLDDIDHVLLRPGMYIGSIKPHTSEKWIINNKKQTQLKRLTYNPGFLKIFDEVITNSVDESKRKGSNLNIIKVKVSKDSISVWDNGGIDVIKHKEHKEWIPEMIFSNLKSGSNFNDKEERYWAGTNGVGSTITNIYSDKFIISTCDGKKVFKQTFKNNMRNRTKPSIKKSKKNHTQITFNPDLKRFGLKEIDDSHFEMIKKRVYDLAACNTHLKIYFNGKVINFKSFKDYIRLYKDDFLYEVKRGHSWSLGLALSEDGFQQVSFANSTDTYDGGTHVDYIMNQIITEMRSYFKSKHKVDVKPSELKNHMFLFLNSVVINPSFSSQTKEKLITEVKEFGTEFEVSKKFIKSILKSEIVNSILDWIEQKKKANESKLQRKLNKNLSKIKVDKLIDSKGKQRHKHTLGIFEGDSATAAYRKYRDPQTMGAFSLRGKFINVNDISNTKLVKSKEAVNLMASIGLKLGQPINIKNLRYGKILLYVDADCDGNSIAAQILNFFYKYWPDMFDRRMVCKVETPIVVANPRGKGKKNFFYTQKEYNDWSKKNNLKKFEIKYKKGLAALVGDEYNDIINNPKLTLITKDDMAGNSLEVWFGKDSSLRKKELLK